MTQLKAVDFEILRDVVANGQIRIPMARKPVRVATVIDEADFSRSNLLRHNRNCFLEDRFHDWDYSNGFFSYYTRVALKADVIVAYAVETVEDLPHPPAA